MDTSSRTSVALTRILCDRLFGIHPALRHARPDLAAMLAESDAALVIGDKALLDRPVVESLPFPVEKMDLGETWTTMTGLPFVWAFWAGTRTALDHEAVGLLQETRDRGCAQAEGVAREYFRDAPEYQALGTAYLRDNIKYHFGPNEHAGLEMFYRYAAETRLIDRVAPLQFFEEGCPHVFRDAGR
jgi:chorismate dehydratase